MHYYSTRLYIYIGTEGGGGGGEGVPRLKVKSPKKSVRNLIETFGQMSCRSMSVKPHHLCLYDIGPLSSPPPPLK